MQANFDIVLNSQRRKQPNVLKGSGNTRAIDLNGIHAVGILAVKQNGTARGLINLGQKVKHSGFARAVWPDKARDFGAANRQVKVIYSGQTPKVDTQPDCFKHGSFVDIPLRYDRAAGNRYHFSHFARPPCGLIF
ncbi:hypothetical protein SDC9_136003 [bioreactor metagenome]|uniref:Uncharacterized protein n=1 Tax=bioreactor metagenome TaxID=1076179 RepID=A0A645DHX2_9ZZZZ